MKFVQLFVRKFDDTGSVEVTFRNDAHGRHDADRWASRRLIDPKVAEVSSDFTDRIAQGTTIEGSER